MYNFLYLKKLIHNLLLQLFENFNKAIILRKLMNTQNLVRKSYKIEFNSTSMFRERNISESCLIEGTIIEDNDKDYECCFSLFHIPSLNKLTSHKVSSSTTSNNTFNQDKNPSYLFYEAMDEANKKATNIMFLNGCDDAVKHMMTKPNGETRTYAEMRVLYG